MTGEIGKPGRQDEVLPNIWDRLDPSVFPQASTGGSEQATHARKLPSRRRKLLWVLYNAVAALVWTWAPVKLFIGDVDRWILGAVAPHWQWLLDYRFLALLALGAFLAIAIRWRRAWGILIYVLFWPLIVAGFYLPRFLYRRHSTLLTIGLAHAILGFFSGFRFTLVAFALVTFSVLGIFVGESTWLISACAITLILVWLVSLVKTVRYAVSPGRFVAGQQRLVQKLLNSKHLWDFVNVDEKLRAPDIEKYNSDQASTLVTRMSVGLAATRACQIWATELDTYRRSPITILFGCLAVFLLFLQGIATFTVVNMAVYKISPAEFAAAYDPTLATFAYYTFASASFGEVSALIPVGNLATATNLLTGVGTGIIVLLFIVALVLGFRQSRADEATTQAIDSIRREADEFEARLGAEYGLGSEALWRQLMELGGGILRLLPFLLHALPDDQSTAFSRQASDGRADSRNGA